MCIYVYIYIILFTPRFLVRIVGEPPRVLKKIQRDKGEKLYFRALYSLYLNVVELQLLYIHTYI